MISNVTNSRSLTSFGSIYKLFGDSRSKKALTDAALEVHENIQAEFNEQINGLFINFDRNIDKNPNSASSNSDTETSNLQGRKKSFFSKIKSFFTKNKIESTAQNIPQNNTQKLNKIA